MEVGVLKQTGTQQGYNSIGGNQSIQTETATKTADNISPGQGSSEESSVEKKKTPLSKQDVSELTEEMNKFLELINSDIQFKLHDKTKQLIVQVVDTRDNKVLKEFPPHEMLDTLARIRDYVGLLLDKRA